MIKVCLVDDHTIVRKGLKQMLEDTTDITVSGEAGSTSAMFGLLKNEHFDVIVLDISLPGRSGVDALKQLKEIDKDLPVLILSMHPPEQYALRVMKSGASGYLTKESAPDELIMAVRQVVRGKKYINAELAEELANYVDGDKPAVSHSKLTDREYEVMREIVKGKSLTTIGEELSLSVKTISTYRRRILNKLGLRNNSELIRYAMEHDLI
ncbi:MAG: response regulator [Bacteroidota bacterium]